MSDSHNDQGTFVDVAENNIEDNAENVTISPVLITAPVSETPAAITSRIQPAPDYASAVREDPPPPPVSNDRAPRRRSYLTQFEKDNFHPYNMLPDRPLTAFFRPSERMDSKAILDSIAALDIPRSGVVCIQQSANGTVHVTFCKSEFHEAFLQRSAFFVNRRPVVAHPDQGPLTYIRIFDVPHELPETALRHRLSKYGTVYSTRESQVQGCPGLFNGIRTCRMLLTSPIPSFLRFGRVQVRIAYEGQRPTCRRCNSLEHLAKDCTNEFCFNCDSIGHKANACPSNMKCCICKEEDHMAIDCNHSWDRRQRSSREADPIHRPPNVDSDSTPPVPTVPPPPSLTSEDSSAMSDEDSNDDSSQGDDAEVPSEEEPSVPPSDLELWPDNSPGVDDQDEDVSFSDVIASESDAPPSRLNRKRRNPDEDSPPAGNKKSCSVPSFDVPPDDVSFSDTENAPT